MSKIKEKIVNNWNKFKKKVTDFVQKVKDFIYRHQVDILVAMFGAIIGFQQAIIIELTKDYNYILGATHGLEGIVNSTESITER